VKIVTFREGPCIYTFIKMVFEKFVLNFKHARQNLKLMSFAYEN